MVSFNIKIVPKYNIVSVVYDHAHKTLPYHVEWGMRLSDRDKLIVNKEDKIRRLSAFLFATSRHSF